MLIHTYFTDGYIGFGKVFIESFKKFHGDEMPMVVTTRNLNEKQISRIKKMYKNLTILNKEIDMEELSRRAKINIPTLLKYKDQIERQRVRRSTNVIWKQYIAVEDRFGNSITEAMKHAGNEKFMMHIDADSYVKKSLESIFEFIMENDVALIFRDSPRKNRKIFAALSGYRLGRNSNTFLTVWKKYIDAVPLDKKPKGYGQTACFYAYRELKKSNIKWGKIPVTWMGSDLSEEAFIWSGNHYRHKSQTLRIFKRDLRRDENNK